MGQIFARQVVKALTLAGQAQDVFQLTNGRLISALNFVVDVNLTTTTGTLNPHPAGVMNLLNRVEVFTSNGQTIIDLSGQDLWDMFRYVEGVEADNVALAGGVAQTTSARATVQLPFQLDDGKQPWDGILQTVTKEVNVRLTYNTPTTAGVLFGTVTGLSAVTASVRVSMEEFRADNDTRAAIIASGVQRSLRKFDYPVTQTNDAFVLDKLPKEVYRKMVLVARSTVNGMETGAVGVIDHTKEMAVKSTADNNIYQKELVRVFRGQTLQGRRNSSVPAGIIDVHLTENGSLAQSISSTTANELFMEVPAVATGTSPYIRVIVDTVKGAAA